MTQHSDQQHATRVAEGSLEMGSSDCWTCQITQPNAGERASQPSLEIRFLDFAAQHPVIHYSPVFLNGFYYSPRPHFSYGSFHWNRDLAAHSPD